MENKVQNVTQVFYPLFLCLHLKMSSAVDPSKEEDVESAQKSVASGVFDID